MLLYLHGARDLVRERHMSTRSRAGDRWMVGAGTAETQRRGNRLKNIYVKSCSASKTQPGQGGRKKWSEKKQIRAALGWQEGNELYVAGPSVFLLGLAREGAHYV